MSLRAAINAPVTDRDVIYKRNPFQKKVKRALGRNKLINAIFAGWRTGKTDYVAIEHIIGRQLYGNPDVRHLIAANTYSQLIDSTLFTLYEKLDEFGIPREPQYLPRVHRPFSLWIWNGEKWVEFLCRSMDNFVIIAGTTLGSIWLDEVWGTEKWTYDFALGRLSDKRSLMRQLVLTTTTDEPTHWMYTDIVAKEKPDLMEIVYGTTHENAHNLAAGYIEGLKSSLDKPMFERVVLSKWVSIAQGKILYNFSRTLHLRSSLRYDPLLPILFSCDFNVNPMCWSIWQQHGEKLWCIDQLKITGRADTETAARELRERYRQCRKFICFGDASGKSGSTRSILSDYDIIQRVFRSAGGPVELELCVPVGNPSVRDSANATNARLLNALGEVRILFDREKCVDVYLSVENISYRPGTHEKDESTDRDPNAVYRTHFSDTVRYIVNWLYPIAPKPKYRSF